ncbi:alpha/beta hydrolase [Calothrix sp. UHCC 0171]|uniref:alpha/beta hydrolase n=1 Tax=Calothrix sp. UHCC 0171 TaxID=3110245 RepID=UPI002B201106|nr:alpha/beta hydrolase [Calothrix sp. UHCC 0171]MEA5569690.1 alpha/beta hydrolase [Calothrix sp. UHCC 0171]
MQFPIDKIKGFLCGLGVVCSWTVATPISQAAEKVIIQLGPFQQTVEISDLENFAKTGKLPQELRAFSSFLTPEVRGLLNQKFQVNPAIGDKFIDELVKTPQGKQLISSLGGIIPGSTSQSLKDTLNLTLRRANGLSVLGFLRSYPGENITVDATKAVSLSLDFNPANLQSQAFGALLEQELVAKNDVVLPKNLNPALPGNQTVQEVSLVLRDSRRNRTIPVDVYSSSAPGQTAIQTPAQQPMVVISHGFGANRQFLRYLALHLASHGITVAAMEHPGSNALAVNRAANNSDLARLLPANEFIARPQDVSFLLDELAKLNSQSGQLQGKLNTDNVTIIGHSLGGYTALALVGGKLDLGALRKFCNNSLGIAEAPGDWLQCAATGLKEGNFDLRDKRIKNAIALNPLVGNLFGKNGLSRINTPVLMLAGTEDALTPALKHQFAPFTQLKESNSKYLLTAIGGTHLSIGDPMYRHNAATNIAREKRGTETKSLREILCGLSLAFIQQQTDTAKIYQPFLSSSYAQSFSTPQLPLRLVTELPGNLKKWAEYAAR